MGGEKINHGLHGLAALTLACFGMAWAAFAAEPTILVSARQRYPWNGLVDLHFTITGDAGTKYDTDYQCEHPTEAGMVRISDRMIPVCEKIIDNL